MRIHTKIVGALLCVLMAGTSSALASPVPLPQPPVSSAAKVAGTTVLKGDRTSGMFVRVAKDAVLDLTPEEQADGSWAPKAMKTSGGGGYVGFTLTERGTAKGLAIVGTRLPRALYDGDKKISAVAAGQPAVMDREASSTPAPLADDGAPSCVQCRVPAGEYRLQLVTYGDAAKVTLTFEGLGSTTTLKPTEDLWAFGMTGRFRQAGGMWSGGGMSMGIGWGGAEQGVALSTYGLQLAPRDIPVAITSAQACRGVGRREQCEDPRITAGTQPSAAGYGLMTGDKVKSVSSSFDYEYLGDGKVEGISTLLWVPTDIRAREVVEIGVSAEAKQGTELYGLRTYWATP